MLLQLKHLLHVQVLELLKVLLRERGLVQEGGMLQILHLYSICE
jgi:hypothetical protein